MRCFWTAVKFLTAFPWPKSFTLAPQEIGQATPFFPLVGFLLGLILVLLNWLLEPYLESEILGVVLVAFLILLTRAGHLEGLGKSFERVTSGASEEKTIGDRVGIFGLLAILMVVMLKFRAIEVMGEMRSQGLLLAPTLSRWSMVILAYSSRPIQEGMGRSIVNQVSGRHLAWATIFALFLALLFASRLGLWIALWVSLLTLVSGLFLRRRSGGISGDDGGAIGEICEAFVLVLFASL